MTMVQFTTRFLVIASSCIALSDSLKCYGAEAFQMAHTGENDCSGSFDGGYWGPCWSKCGGVTEFSSTFGDEDPSGKALCPYRDDGQPGYSSSPSKIMPCNCSMWRQPLPGGKCPNCDDFNAVSPLMITVSRDAAAAGIELGTCPPGYDMCFNYCVNRDRLREEFYTHCAYGCAKMANKAILELLIATKLSEIDKNSINPVEYVCEAWSYECTETFCSSDGCNQLAALPKLRGWAHVYEDRRLHYVHMALISLQLACMCCAIVVKRREANQHQYEPI